MYINAAANRREGLEATPVNKASGALLVNIGGSGNLYSPWSLIKMFWSFPLPTLVTLCQIIVSILTKARAAKVPNVLGDRKQRPAFTYNSERLKTSQDSVCEVNTQKRFVRLRE